MSSDRPLITDLVQIRRLGEQREDENKRLRQHMKRHVFVERKMKAIAQEVEEEIDCLQCANCCRVATAKLIDRDIERVAKAAGMSISRFVTECTEISEEEGRILKRNEKGCVFLHGNECLVYEGRPASCQDFPHLVRGPGSLLNRMWAMPDRAKYCPITYNTLERWKDELEFQRSV
jgi:uncharacterized protein